MSYLFDGVEITWDLGAADLALKCRAAVSSLFDLGQLLNLSGNLYFHLSRTGGTSLMLWSPELYVNSYGTG